MADGADPGKNCQADNNTQTEEDDGIQPNPYSMHGSDLCEENKKLSLSDNKSIADVERQAHANKREFFLTQRSVLKFLVVVGGVGGTMHCWGKQAL